MVDSKEKGLIQFPYQRKTLTDLNNSLVTQNLNVALINALGLEFEVPRGFPFSRVPEAIKPAKRSSGNPSEYIKLMWLTEKPFIETKLWTVVDMVAHDEYDKKSAEALAAQIRLDQLRGAVDRYNEQRRLEGQSEFYTDIDKPVFKDPDEPPMWEYKGWTMYAYSLTRDPAEILEIIKEIAKNYNREEGHSLFWERVPGFSRIIDFVDFHKSWYRRQGQKWEHIHGVIPIPEQAEGVRQLGDSGSPILGRVLSPVSIETNSPSYLKKDLRAKLNRTDFNLLAYLDRFLPALSMRRFPFVGSARYFKLASNYLFALIASTEVTEDDLNMVDDLIFLRELFKTTFGLDDRIRIHIPWHVPQSEQLGEGWGKYIFHPSGPGKLAQLTFEAI